MRGAFINGVEAEVLDTGLHIEGLALDPLGATLIPRYGIEGKAVDLLESRRIRPRRLIQDVLCEVQGGYSATAEPDNVERDALSFAGGFRVRYNCVQNP